MRIRLALTLAAVLAFAISLPAPAAAMGSLWPHGTIGGKSFDPGPRDWVEYSELRNKFTKSVQHNAPAWDGRWITVLP